MARREGPGHQKKALKKDAWILSLDESAVSNSPTVLKTWGIKGITPVLEQLWAHWKHLSACGTIAYRPSTGESNASFQLLQGSHSAWDLIPLLIDHANAGRPFHTT